MQVLNTNAGLLSNYEVYAVLKQEHITRSQSLMATTQASDFQDLYTVEFESIRYLEQHSPSIHQTPDQIRYFMTEIHKFATLTKAEKLSLINMRPVSVVELFMHIEECETRMTEDELVQLLNIIYSCFPLPLANDDRMQDVSNETQLSLEQQQDDENAPLF